MDESMPILTETEGEHEYCMVFSLAQAKEPKFEDIKERLKAKKVEVTESHSRDEDEIFLYLTTSDKVFEKYAEVLQIPKMLVKGSEAPFRRKVKESFLDYVPNRNYFTSYERSLVMLHLIQAPGSRGGAGIDIGRGIAKGWFNQCFPLHDPKEKGELFRLWVRRSYKLSLAQDLILVKKYYGEYITMYFAWLQHYTRWLVIPAIPGVILGIVGFILGFDNPTVPFYSFFIAIWATIYLESWKRRNSTIVSEWGVTDTKSQERVRPSFRGTERAGVYVNGTFLNLEKGATDKTPRVEVFSSNVKSVRYSVGFSVLVTFLGVVIVATFGLVAARIAMGNNASISKFTAIIGGIANAVTILILNAIYSKIASFLTEWENHRTESEWERSFIIKSFLFQFTNSYISLFYTAFIKEHYDLFGVGRLTSAEGENYRPMCANHDCLGEVATLLGTIFLTNIFVGQFQETAVPWIKSKVNLYLEDRAMRKRDRFVEASRPEQESKLGYYESTFDDYNEMAIQFGYITLFAAAFPLAPVAALGNNIVELRTDALKLLTGMQRTHPKGASDIGIWLQILEIMNYAAVLTNCGLIFVTSDWMSGKLGWELSDLFLAALIAEHVLLIVKWSLSQIIPDTPSKVLQAEAMKAYNRNKLIEQYASQNKDGLADLLNSGVFIDEGRDLAEDDIASQEDHVTVHLDEPHQ
eukprot:TRINITY_DN688_c0_g1_i1.p1 TRINITY_DN688_c0_g1~~TRINITY_DN688_c0_g1_i1.p1  ORF type:complete len:694 (+),score=219.85 TRINITY_DN688_c0_g1_i1:123-2204(+)